MADDAHGAILGAVYALMRAARWTEAAQLLAAANDQAGEAEVALARAQLVAEVFQWQGTGDPAAALKVATVRVGDRGDPGLAYDLELLRLFSDYWAELIPGDGRPPSFGPAGRDPAVLDDLDRRAGQLTQTAPDARRMARATFYAGLVADNLRGEPRRAEELFTRALAACRPAADDDYAAEALRHLGGCAQAAGDLKLAREQWERSAALAEQAGWLPLALAQQALLADLSADEGDLAAARTLAAEVRRWSTALGLARLAAQAEATLSR
jgi:tetratricopeptide (TPR) repeat protein